MARVGLVVLVAALVVAGVAAGAWLLFRDHAAPASVEEAVTSFREETGEAPAGDSPVPEGVYVYATEGSERTDALTGVTHRYPARSTITVTGHPCGVRMRWDVLEGRSTEWVLCTEEDGWTLRSQDERHTFFGRTERTTYTCTRGTLRPAGDQVGASSEVVCSADGTREHGEVRVEARERVTVAGGDVETVHVVRTSSFEGETRGSSRHDLWLARETGVPVRVVMSSRTVNDSPVGDVRYEEDVTLRLRSLEPRR